MSSTTFSTKMLANAYDLAANRQFKIFPLHNPTGDAKERGCSCGNPKCGRVGKHPRIKNHLNRATTDPTQLMKWWAKWQDANIGIVTGKKSGFFVLDVDGDIGAASLKSLEENNSPLPVTLTAITGKGKHIYFQYPDTRIKTGKRADGFEVKGENGSCNAPPSLHRNGKTYQWVNADAPIAAAPEWLISRLTEEDVPTPASDSDEVIPEGQRNATMYAEVCNLFKTGAGKEDVLRSALEINQSRCKPPLPDADVHSMVASVAKTHKPSKAKPSKYSRSSRNPLYWFPFDVHSFFADQNTQTLTAAQLGWRTRLMAFAWQSKGFLVNDTDALFKLSNADNKKQFRNSYRTALYDFEVVTLNGKSCLVNHAFAEQYADKMDGWNQKREAGRARAEAKATESEKKRREATPAETKVEVAA
jgi:hypothetical protein